MTSERFSCLVRQEQASLRRFLLSLCRGDAARADELAQTAIIKAFISFDKFEGRSKFSTWLFRIAYNCFYDDCKSSLRRKAGPIDREAMCVADECRADDKFKYQMLQDAIKALPEEEKAIVLLFYQEDKPIREIMEITGMPEGTVKTKLYRGRQHLRKYLENEDR